MASMRAMGEVDKLCVHHSAGSRGSVAEFRSEHRAKGWADIGYHAVIGNGAGAENGEVEAGRSERWEGAGVFGANAGVLHVCLVGNFDEGPPTPEQLRSLGHWLVNRCRTYRPGGALPVFAHCELAVPGHGTACPGDWWTGKDRVRLGMLRTWLRARLGKGTVSTDLELDEWLRREELR